MYSICAKCCAHATWRCDDKAIQACAGNVVQMQSALHQERLLRQEREDAVAQSAAEKVEIESRCKDLQAKLRVRIHPASSLTVHQSF